MGQFQAAAQQRSSPWGRLSLGHRIILALLCFLSVGAVVAAVIWAGAPDYRILYTELSAKDCAALVASLEDAGIRARVSEEGSAVLVPSSKIHQARMAAAGKGMPSGGRLGFEAFREPKIGMTPFAERVNYLNALQSELATTITSLESVSYARVHLVMPERALFKKDQGRASASVLVVTRGGARLPREEALGIANLVASAVEGLAPADVTITDAQGNLLAGAEQDGPEMAADDQFAYRQRVEAYLSSKAETMLARLLGHGRCEVRISAELDFKDMRETKRTYDPDGRVVVSERIESSKSVGRGGGQAGGAVGAAGNVPGEEQAAGAAPAGGDETKTENIDTSYLVSESLTETVDRGATIKRLSVAAFVDTSGGGGGGGEGGGEGGSAGGPVPTIEDISRIIKDAVGIDESRGDTLKIVEAGFRPAGAELAEVGGGAPGWVAGAGQYFAIGALGLVLLFVARRVMKAVAAAAPRRVVVPEVMGAGGEGGPGGLSQDELVRREIAKFVQQSPEAAGRMLEGWVEGEE